MIHKTDDLSIFKKHLNNRVVDKNNLNKIVNSLKLRNMLDLRPIVVTKDLEVIDGQHRLEACKILGLPIYYMINEKSREEDIILLNANQKSWSQDDYLNYYASKGIPGYKRVKDFLEKNQLTFRQFTGFCSMGPEMRDSFKSGDFEFTAEKESEIKEVLFKLNTFVDLVNRKSLNKMGFLSGHTSWGALSFLFRLERFDFALFLSKVELNLDRVRKCTTRESYLTMFKAIYNYKNQNPLD